MAVKELLLQVHDELLHCFKTLDESQLQNLKYCILHANRVFVAGAGRSLLMIRGLAMRLMHMGYTSFVVGETITPAIQPGDLLVIASGSGSTETLTVIAEKCKRIGAQLALITTTPHSPIRLLADYIVQVRAVTTKEQSSIDKFIQLGANTFEQSVLLIADAIVTDITRDAHIDETNREIMLRHANLE